MTDAEWATLGPMVRRAATGRPPSDLRRRWDAIFWIACSRLPWHALPAHLGKPDTAHRALRRFARAGHLLRLLVAVAGEPPAGLEALRWRICRAARRMAKCVNLGLVLAAERLGLADALPCAPHQLPRPGLSESLMLHVRFLPWMDRLPTLVPWLRRLHRLMVGEYRAWRLVA